MDGRTVWRGVGTALAATALLASQAHAQHLSVRDVTPKAATSCAAFQGTPQGDEPVVVWNAGTGNPVLFWQEQVTKDLNGRSVPAGYRLHRQNLTEDGAANGAAVT